MSILLRPTLQPEEAVLITCAAAVAVSNAILEVCGQEVQIKWVNDLFLQEKKVCGILTEAAFSAQTPGFEYAVCGIGINVYPPEDGFPEELASIAGAVCATPACRRYSAAFFPILPESAPPGIPSGIPPALHGDRAGHLHPARRAPNPRNRVGY